MKNGNGKHASLGPQPKGDNVAKLLRENNALLLELLRSLIAIRADAKTIMLYLPACASELEASKEVVMRLVEASQQEDNRLRSEARKRLKKGSD